MGLVGTVALTKIFEIFFYIKVLEVLTTENLKKNIITKGYESDTHFY